MPHDIDFFDCNALTGSPNDDPAADAEVNTLAHETEETNTDEDLNAWYDNSGNENADKCAWNFGATYTRSEEHTSELQSRLHLVCRLLLEKKKSKQQTV